MIYATYYRGYNRLVVTGHAKSAEYGHDLVCCAVSTLIYTLSANVAHMADERQVRDPITRTAAGNAEISCRPRHNLKAVVTMVFDSICIGLELLANQYPEYITYEIRP